MSVRIFVVLALVCWQAACQPSDPSSSPTPPSRADLVIAGPGPVPAEVAAARTRALQEGRRLVVYVGATWCQPCEHFLSAVQAGDLPAHFGDLRFLKFDHDHDETRLNESGYGGELIPRFVVPAADGAATANRFEGSTKGPEAMTNIVPRLEGILAAP